MGFARSPRSSSPVLSCSHSPPAPPELPAGAELADPVATSPRPCSPVFSCLCRSPPVPPGLPAGAERADPVATPHRPLTHLGLYFPVFSCPCPRPAPPGLSTYRSPLSPVSFIPPVFLDHPGCSSPGPVLQVLPLVRADSSKGSSFDSSGSFKWLLWRRFSLHLSSWVPYPSCSSRASCPLGCSSHVPLGPIRSCPAQPVFSRSKVFICLPLGWGPLGVPVLTPVPSVPVAVLAPLVPVLWGGDAPLSPSPVLKGSL